MLFITFVFLLLLIVPSVFGYSEVFLKINGGLRVKICFALFSVELSNFRDKKKKRKKNAEIGHLIMRTVSDAIEHCEVHIRSIGLPVSKGDENPYLSAIERYRYRGIISAIIAYFDSKAQKLVIHDKAFTLIPDENAEFSSIISLKLRTYKLIVLLIRLYRKSKERKSYYVGK